MRRIGAGESPLLFIRMTDNQQAARLKALWKSGRDKYQSFFAVLEEVRQEIGNEELPAWCRNELAIGLSVITNVRSILLKADAERAATSLAAARKAEKEQRELERAKHAAELARLKAEKKAADDDAEKVEHRKKVRQTDRKNPNKRGPKAGAKSSRRKIVTKLSDADLNELLDRFKKADAMCSKADVQWVEGSIAKAQVLCAMRDQYPSNQDFGDWLAAHGIDIEYHQRSALINLGNLEEKRLREILTNTDSRSYEQIWLNNKPKLKVVEN